MEELIEENWIREGRVVRGPRGRPSTMLSVNENLVTFALDLRPDSAIIAMVDLSGRFLAQETVLILSDPAASTARIVEHMQVLRRQFSERQIVGVGVSVPGRVDPVTQRILLAPNLNWHGFDLRNELGNALDLQVEVDNDANACLLSELWYGRMAGVQNAVLIAVAEGLGTAILANGQVISGHRGMAGEFGHISIDPSEGPACGCGQRGCWEMFASSRAALGIYREICPAPRASSILDLLRLADEGDPSADEAVTRQMQALGRGMRLITAALSPEVILITGEVTSVWNKYGHIVEKELMRSMLALPAPRLAALGDGYRARLSGGAAMLMQRHSRYHRSTDPSRQRRPFAHHGS